MGSWTWDPTADVVEWSDGMRRIYGLGPDEPTPSYAEQQQFYDPETIAETGAAVGACLAGGGSYEMEFDITRRDGSRRHLSARGEPIRDASGVVVGIRGSVIDATASHLAAMAVQESEARAQDLVEQLRKADAGKNAFISSLSHELRNPLASVVLAFHQMRERNSADAETMRAWEIAERQSQHLTRLVGDLLDVTRMTHNTIRIHPERVELNDLAWKVANDNWAFFQGWGVALKVWACATPVEVDADPARLVQAIGNLLHNAAKFSEMGDTVVMEVQEDVTLQQAVVTVTDTGRGITAERLPSLFEPFMQADSATDRGLGGLGLGLTIVRQIAGLHGGSVTAESDGPGLGSQFTLRLPLAGPQAAESMEPAREAAPDTRSLQILLIEDDDLLRELTAFQLTKLGHEVVARADGAEGIAAAQEHVPDLIISDIGMPGMFGYDVARAIRGDHSFDGVELIALSGYGQPGDITEALAAGFDRHLTKPVDIKTLEAVLAEVAESCA